jgi:hypothetical protein
LYVYANEFGHVEVNHPAYQAASLSQMQGPHDADPADALRGRL